MALGLVAQWAADQDNGNSTTYIVQHVRDTVQWVHNQFTHTKVTP